MYLTMIASVILFMAVMLIMMYIIEGAVRTRRNEKILWKIGQMDKVETLTGGLSHDRIYEKNPDTGKIRSRKSGDYGNEVKN